jgi:hypothetical protein
VAGEYIYIKGRRETLKPPNQLDIKTTTLGLVAVDSASD